MPLGYEGRLYILAFDHRGSFRRMLEIEGREATGSEQQTLQDAKRLIWEGFQWALGEGAPVEAAGILVDEELGAEVAREAKEAGVNFAMPVEATGRDVFEFEFGDAFGEHIEDFDPTFSKVLVRHNPDHPDDNRQTQIERLKQLSEWLHQRDRKFLFELLVPATEAQLDKVDGDEERYDKELRPDLMIQAIHELQDGGVEPDIWKIEGIDQREDCERIVESIRRGGRDEVVAVVLGRGANDAAVKTWLMGAAPVEGYVGFAVGRTLWRPPVQAYLDGEKEREAAAEQIGINYLSFIDLYERLSG